MDPITVADVFQSNLFTSTSLTSAVNEIAYVPTLLMEMNLFEVQGIPTTTAFIERKGDVLALVQSTPRGGPGTNVARNLREAIAFTAAHLQLEDKIYADEIQNVRAFGSGNQLEGVEQVRDQRLLTMSRSLDLTLEYHRLGAIQGLVLDADGTTVLADLYDKFGISAPADVPMDLSAAWTQDDGGVLQQKLNPVLREIDAELGGISPSGYAALAGDDYFDALVTHPERRETYKFQSEAAALRDDGRRVFTYGGVKWINYRGTGAVKIDDAEARLFPLGVPGLFKQLFSPADTMEAVNTMGRVKYALAVPDPSGKNKFLELEVQSNPITYCERPKVLRKLKAGSS